MYVLVPLDVFSDSLRQFKPTHDIIPTEVITDFVDKLRETDRRHQSIIRMSKVDDIAKKHHQKYVHMTRRIFAHILLNPKKLPILNDEELRNIIERLRTIQVLFHYLQNTEKIPKGKFLPVFFLHRVLEDMGKYQIQKCYPLKIGAKVKEQATKSYAIIVDFLKRILMGGSSSSSSYSSLSSSSSSSSSSSQGAPLAVSRARGGGSGSGSSVQTMK